MTSPSSKLTLAPESGRRATALAQAEEPASVSRDSEAELSAQIEDLLDGGWQGLQFPPPLESRFQNDVAPERVRLLLINSLLVVLTYNSLLVTDWLMVPDRFQQALQLRLMLFTPLTAALMLVAMHFRRPYLREAAGALIGIAASAISAWICVTSQNELAPAYLISLVSLMTFRSGVARMRFRTALFMDVFVIASAIASVWLLHERAPLALLLPVVMTITATAVFTLYGCYTMEKDERRNWLMRLRSQTLLNELASANEHLRRASRTDPLTGLANRRSLDEFVSESWGAVQRAGGDLTVLMVDIDHFQPFNAAHGAAKGDAQLREVAVVLRHSVPSGDHLLGRFGGDEFVVVLPNVALNEGLVLAEAIRQRVAHLHAGDGGRSDQAATVSIGVACMRPAAPQASPGQLLAAADEALRQAKEAGRNRVFAFATT